MAGRDGTVTLILRVPYELRLIAVHYQKYRRMPSLNQAIIELLETHPALAVIMSDLYTERQVSESTAVRT